MEKMNMLDELCDYDPVLAVQIEDADEDDIESVYMAFMKLLKLEQNGDHQGVKKARAQLDAATEAALG